MKVIKKTATIALSAAVAGLCCAAPAGAHPVDDPCRAAGTVSVNFLCRMMPIAPTLDHDVDLTQGSATINGQPLPQLPAPTPGATAAAPAGGS
jgi:hypothetical protein